MKYLNNLKDSMFINTNIYLELFHNIENKLFEEIKQELLLSSKTLKIISNYIRAIEND